MFFYLAKEKRRVTDDGVASRAVVQGGGISSVRGHE